MRFALPQFMRRYLRGLHRADTCPILLPHFTIKEDGLAAIDGSFERLPSELLSALRLCDGTRRLREIARQAAVARSRLVQLHDEGRIILWPVPIAPAAAAPERPITSVIVSPHPDDAALSAFTWMQGHDRMDRKPLVLDIFSRTSWWRFEPRCPEEIQRTRQEEERLVTKLTGASLRQLDLPEALLRGYAMQEVFQPASASAVPSRDAGVRAQLATALDDLLRRHAGALWFLPLGVGGHVDHLITRDETLAALKRAGASPERIFFYEDLPYAAELPGVPDFAHAIPGRNLRLGPCMAIPENMKTECLRAYWSQLTWGQIEKVRQYAQRVGHASPIERTWQLMHR